MNVTYTLHGGYLVMNVFQADGLIELLEHNASWCDAGLTLL